MAEPKSCSGEFQLYVHVLSYSQNRHPSALRPLLKELCKSFDGTVYLTSRDEHRGIGPLSNNSKNWGCIPNIIKLDIDDEDSVLKLRDHLKATYGGLGYLG
jgi:hypothetical protein